MTSAYPIVDYKGKQWGGAGTDTVTENTIDLLVRSDTGFLWNLINKEAAVGIGE